MTFLRKVAITVAITFLGKSSGSDYKKKCSKPNSAELCLELYIYSIYTRWKEFISFM